MRVWSSRAGVTTGDVLIVVAVLVLGIALVMPFFRERARRLQLRETITAVEALRIAALLHFESYRDWPSPSPPGAAPDELAGAVAAPLLASTNHVLQWVRWEVVDEPEHIELDQPEVLPEDSTQVPLARPTLHTIGGVSVHSGDRTLLAGLLDRYGRSSSFVRDTVWTLVLPMRSDAR